MTATNMCSNFGSKWSGPPNCSFNSKIVSLMADEVMDIMNMEQVICLCHVDENFEPHEDFVSCS